MLRRFLGKRDVSQPGAKVKCTITYLSDTIWNRYALQADAIDESVAPDARNGKAIDNTRNAYFPAWPRVSRYGDRTVIGYESELGLHRGGQRQQQQRQQSGAAGG